MGFNFNKSMVMLKILIVEDEQTAARRLERILGETGYPVEITGIIDSIEDTVNFLRFANKPDLILMDIHLADGSCFEIFNQVDVLIPVIFITAFDQYAINAFKVNSIDYLLKPVNRQELKNALDKFSRLQRPPASIYEVLKELSPSKTAWQKRFIIKAGNTHKAIETADIAMFYAEDKVVMLLTLGEDRYIVDQTLDRLETILDPGRFYRISRKVIIHDKAIKSISPYFRGKIKLDLVLRTPIEVIVSSEKSDLFKSWFEKG